LEAKKCSQILIYTNVSHVSQMISVLQ
jgi:hypothetical protein